MGHTHVRVIGSKITSSIPRRFLTRNQVHIGIGDTDDTTHINLKKIGWISDTKHASLHGKPKAKHANEFGHEISQIKKIP